MQQESKVCASANGVAGILRFRHTCQPTKVIGGFFIIGFSMSLIRIRLDLGKRPEGRTMEMQGSVAIFTQIWRDSQPNLL